MAASAETTPSGPSYAPPSRTESRWEPVSTASAVDGHRRAAPPRDQVADTVALDARGRAPRTARGTTRAASRSAEVNGWRKYPPLAADRPTGARSRHICSKSALGMIGSMEFQDVVASAGWSATTPPSRSTRPSSTGCCATRCTRRAPASARAGRSWCSTRPDGRATGYWARRPPTPDGATRTAGCAGCGRAPVLDRAAVEQGGLPRPLRRAGQGLGRPGRGAAGRCPTGTSTPAMAVAADPADRGRRGARRLLLRDPAERTDAVPRRVRGAGRVHPDRRDHPGPPHRATPGAAGSASRGRRPAEEVVHRGGW